MRPEDQWAEPPLHQKLEVAMSMLGWLTLAGMAAGSAWWCRAVRQVLHGN